LLVGNDIVDLLEADAAAKPRNERFLDRVFTLPEKAAIAAADDPALALWMLWSGKESVFKIAKKLNPNAVFAHTAYNYSDATLAQIGPTALIETISVAMHFENRDILLHWQWNKDYVHCVASWGADQVCSRVATTAESCSGALSTRESESVHSTESRAVRLLAKSMLLDQLDSKNLEIVRSKSSTGFFPPAVWIDGEPVSGIDISLSHDGRFVAAVITSTDISDGIKL
jgi:phosphopantetheinyl transferase (holo-ACP synthase)